MINSVTGLKKGEKKFGKSLEVQKKSLPLQSRLKQGGLTKTASDRQGVRKRGAEVPEYDEVH